MRPDGGGEVYTFENSGGAQHVSSLLSVRAFRKGGGVGQEGKWVRLEKGGGGQ